jgi:hypothetical protein
MSEKERWFVLKKLNIFGCGLMIGGGVEYLIGRIISDGEPLRMSGAMLVLLGAISSFIGVVFFYLRRSKK